MDGRALPRLHLRRLHDGRHRHPRQPSATPPATLVRRVRAVTDKPVCVGSGGVERRPGGRGRRPSPTASSSGRPSCGRCSTPALRRRVSSRSRSSRSSWPTACGAADDETARGPGRRRGAARGLRVRQHHRRGHRQRREGVARHGGLRRVPAARADLHRHRGPGRDARRPRDHAGDAGLPRLHALPGHLQRRPGQFRLGPARHRALGAQGRPAAVRHDRPGAGHPGRRPRSTSTGSTRRTRAWSLRSGRWRRSPRPSTSATRSRTGRTAAATRSDHGTYTTGFVDGTARDRSGRRRPASPTCVPTSPGSPGRRTAYPDRR